MTSTIQSNPAFINIITITTTTLPTIMSSLYSVTRSLALRTRSIRQVPHAASRQVLPQFTQQTRRSYADDAPKKGPNEDTAPHVSEEAAQQAEIMGETKPDIAGQGTPVQEILQRDSEAMKNAPEIVKEDVSQHNEPPTPKTKASANEATTFENLIALGKLEALAKEASESADADIYLGHKFPLPDLPIPSQMNMEHRYDTVVDQVTNLLMVDGKKSVAQRNMSFILNHLRTAPPPKVDPSRPLLPGSPPAHTLPLNPILYLTLALDSVAPLLRIRLQKGAAGGGNSLQIPVPLSLRQRRRTAMQWILDAVEKKKSKGSGRSMFAQRVAEEIVAIAEGKSGAWEKRQSVHKVATGSRANLNYQQQKRK